jgi:hypothetical protein
MSDTETIQQLSEEFDHLCQARHDGGEETYGPYKFLEVDTVRFAAEELADLSNYSRYLYIKLRLIQERLREGGIDLSASITSQVRKVDKLPSYPAAFVSSAEVSGFLPTESKNR